MGKFPQLQSVDGDLVDCQPWTAPMEGAFTKTAKVAILNALAPRALAELLFGRQLLGSSFAEVHGRSFLNGVWASPKAQGAAGRSVLSGFMTHYCGNWATLIASDERLRLCKACADLGYQSVLFQIDALTMCPIHRLPLIDHCPHCNEPTPRYALTTEAFESPMQCASCGRGYGRAWDGAADFDAWVGPADTRPLQQIAKRMQTWSHLQLEWPEVSSWVADPTVQAAPRRRVHVSLALTLLSSASATLDHCVRTYSSSCERTTLQTRRPRLEPRVAIYKAIRRHILRRLGIGRLRRGFKFSETFYHHRTNETIVPRRMACPPELHAFVLWTRRCEEEHWSPMDRWTSGRNTPSSARGVQLRANLLLWPSDIQVSDAAWGHFVWACFVEDLWTAWRWQAEVSSLGEPLENDDMAQPSVQQQRAEFLEKLAIWTPRMSPLIEALPSGISHFSCQQGRGARRFFLLTIKRFEGACHVSPRC